MLALLAVLACSQMLVSAAGGVGAHVYVDDCFQEIASPESCNNCCANEGYVGKIQSLAIGQVRMCYCYEKKQKKGCFGCI